jgi:hypothetical protein
MMKRGLRKGVMMTPEAILPFLARGIYLDDDAMHVYVMIVLHVQGMQITVTEIWKERKNGQHGSFVDWRRRGGDFVGRLDWIDETNGVGPDLIDQLSSHIPIVQSLTLARTFPLTIASGTGP